MITKTDFLVYLEAPRHLWAIKHGSYDETLSDFDKHLIQQGYIVEEKAREYALKYILPNYSEDTDDIQFQKTCVDGNFEARTDIFVKNKGTGSWDIYEVKSVTTPKSEHYYDATFQTIIFEKQFNIGKTHLLYVNGNYVRDGDFDLYQFLKIEDVTGKVNELKDETRDMMQECELLETTDNYKIATECWKPKDCRCKELCFPKLPENSIYTLARVTEKKINALKDEDILDLKDIPLDFDLTANQLVQVEVAKRGKPLVDKEAIAEDLNTLEYPIYFLDYESYNPAIPMFDGYKPYQHMVFQYSLHILDSFTSTEFEHYEFIASDGEEPSKQLLKSLESHIGNTGSVVVWYKSFECTRNKEMSKLNPEYEQFLNSINDRTYDLMDIFKKNYYVDSKFKGSNSIKDVLPVLVPELNYKNLDIQNGSMAMISWFDAVYKNTANEDREKTLESLFRYCEQDTLAMVRVWEFLKSLF